MTRAETARVLQAIMIFWPGSRVRADELTVSLWGDALADLPAEAVELAVKRLAATLKFPPTVADIREAVVEAANAARGVVPAAEAWRQVVSAVRLFGFYRPAEARAYVGEETWRAVEAVGGWRELCLGEFSVLSAQFERRYLAQQAWEAEKLQIPEAVREGFDRLLGPLLEEMALPEGGEADGL